MLELEKAQRRDAGCAEVWSSEHRKSDGAG